MTFDDIHQIAFINNVKIDVKELFGFSLLLKVTGSKNNRKSFISHMEKEKPAHLKFYFPENLLKMVRSVKNEI